jgi:protein ImuB
MEAPAHGRNANQRSQPTPILNCALRGDSSTFDFEAWMFACIYIPDFPVEAIVRVEPWLREQAVAVLEGKSPLVRVVALNEKARCLGMEVGMTKLQAAVFSAPANEVAHSSKARVENSKTTQIELSSRCTRSHPKPGLAMLRQRSAAQENSAHAALLDVAHAFTPRVEDTASDTLLLDLAGLGRLYGAPATMARDLASRVNAIALEANIALAANPEAALHAARGFNGTTVLPAGEEAHRLGVLPLQVLLDAFDISLNNGPASDREREKLGEQMLDTLERWGVRDFRTLALLPEHALASRLGEAGTRLQRLARGAGMRTLALCEPVTHFEEAMELESPVETLEPLSFVLNRLLEQLCARLEARARAAQELHLRLRLERRVADEETTTAQELAGASSHVVGGENTAEHIVRLPVAMRDTKVFLKLLQLELAAHPPGAPITKVWIAAEPAPPRSAQRGLFLPVTPEAEKLEITLARINGIVGERRAGIARLLDTHRRDGFLVDRFVASAEEPRQTVAPTMSDAKEPARLALRMFRPPWQLQVRLAEGRPVALTAVTKLARRGELQGKVLWSAGPWRSSGDWWTKNAKEESASKDSACPWHREEWDVALANENGGSVALYCIYRDLASGQWFAEASYD